MAQPAPGARSQKQDPDWTPEGRGRSATGVDDRSPGATTGTDGRGTDDDRGGGDTGKGADDRASERIRDAGGDRWIRGIARTGLVARGAVYVIIGIIALRIALNGSGGEEDPDSEGAIRTLAEQPFGSTLLVLLCLGFLAHAAWRFIRAVLGAEDDDGGPRRWATTASDVVTGAVYLGLLTTTVLILLGDASGGEDESTWTARLMDVPAGRALVVAGGLFAIGLGIYWAARVVHRRFQPSLDDAAMGPTARTWVPRLGSVGYVARSLTAGMIGVFLIQAAVRHDPDEAEGLDGALQALGQATYGSLLLAAVAVCLMAYGLFSCCQAKWAQVDPTA